MGPIRRPKRRRPHADKWLRRPKKGGKRPKKGGKRPKKGGKRPKKGSKRPKKGGKRPKKGGKRPKKGKKPSRVSYLLGRFPGLYTVRFPKVTFGFVIAHRRVTIGKKTIKLRPSTNKKYIGWWTFPFHRVTYYIKFTSKGIRILTI